MRVRSSRLSANYKNMLNFHECRYIKVPAMPTLTINVSTTVKQATDHLQNYQRVRLPNATRLALNETTRNTAVQLSKEIRKHVKLTAAKVNSLVTRRFAKAGVINAGLRVKGGQPPNLGSFKVLKSRAIANKRRRLAGEGVRAAVYEKAVTYRGAFAWYRPGAGGEGTAITVFKRVRGQKVAPTQRLGGDRKIRRFKRGPKKGQVVLREKLKAVFGPDITQAALQKQAGGPPIIQVVETFARDRFRTNLQRQIERLRRE